MLAPSLLQRLAAHARARVPPDAAENLAVFRIVVGLVVLSCAELRLAPKAAALPAALRSPPQDLGAWLLYLPMTPSLVRGAAVLVMGAAVLGALGLWARAAFTVVALLGTYALGAAMLGGSVWHCHHLIWFSALLAVSPCDDALSLRAWWAARRGRQVPVPRCDPAYGLPIRLVWALLALIFFFPGLWKLRASGLEWITSDNLRYQMLAKWLQAGGVLPLVRVDRWPTLCRLAAAAVVALELGFPLLLLTRRGRTAALLLALLFHLGTSLFMGFSFSVLWPCYVVLIDWTPLVRGLRRPPASRPAPPAVAHRARRLWPCGLVGGVLLLGNGLLGLRGQTQGWPLACYPTFQHTATQTLPALLLYAVRPDGSESELPRPWQLGGTHAPRAWALLWSVIGTGRREVDPVRLRAYFQHVRSHPSVERAVRGACAVRFFRARLSVLPEDWAAPVRRKDAVLLYTLPLADCSTAAAR